MTTWEEIRDEVAGMLADGKPLEDVIGKLEKQKNEMAKANLIAVMDEMKKPKPQTEQEYLQSCNTEQLAEWIVKQKCYGCNDEPYDEKHGTCKYCMAKKTEQVREWLKQPHTEE